MKLSKLNNVVVKNSLYVLLFVISYTALLRYYKTEFFVDTTIDSVFGWAGNHENPDAKNQTEESCRQLALKDPKYVAWGYRTNDHGDPNWRNTCFLYTQGFQPFNGNPSDTAHKTGCLRPGEKVSLGCKVPPTQPVTATADVPCQAASEQYLKDNVDVKNAKVDAWTHYTENGKREGRKWNSALCTTSTVSPPPIVATTTTTDIPCQAASEQYLKDNVDVKNAKVDAWTHYTENGKREGRKWNSALCTTSTVSPPPVVATTQPQAAAIPPPPVVATTQPIVVANTQPLTKTVVVTNKTVSKSILDPEYNFNKLVEKKKQSYTGKERIDFVVQLANELAPEHRQLVCIAFYWFIMKKSQQTDGSKDNDNWAKSLNEVGLPYEMYANLLPRLLAWTMGSNGTLDTLANQLSDNEMSVYIQRYIQRYNNFVPYSVQNYRNTLENIDWINFKQNTSDVLKLETRSTNVSLPQLPPRSDDKPTSIVAKPILLPPVFQAYKPDNVNNTSETTKDMSVEPAKSSNASDNNTTSTTTASPTSFFASVSSKVTMYILLSIVVSIMLVVLVIWGAIRFTKAKTVPNSAF